MKQGTTVQLTQQHKLNPIELCLKSFALPAVLDFIFAK